MLSEVMDLRKLPGSNSFGLFSAFEQICRLSNNAEQ